MSLKTLLAATAALSLAAPALAEIEIKDAYARAAMPNAKAGAAFMHIVNTGTEDDRLVGAASGIAGKTELHTHIDDGNGIMKMVHVEEGFPIPAGGMHMLKRGGDHVMFMGLKGPMNDGENVTVTLRFEKAGDVTVEIPIDLQRKEGEMKMDGH
ncbi:copper chaperone PCu(A)C [Aliiruegeria sabulilitoris]|uniref:copper chaperone PCu(A)C n=1 Tax=Aliiruegeria sabulilitoris TaxID=1510458 RepID=UPI0008377C36|nr:copper chaperone PCu(A)C [Aliiruegeria sabulilitoris]NDR57380.1 copper chaperone PCu(A)C [Pseudoruegeria sp. M32A2M]